LFISGADDPAAGPDEMAPLLDMLPGTKMHIVPDAGHIANMENPENFNKALTDFLNNL
jgi:pimeloyl-ACP methyl ester carboxylesterase